MRAQWQISLSTQPELRRCIRLKRIRSRAIKLRGFLEILSQEAFKFNHRSRSLNQRCLSTVPVRMLSLG